MKLLILNILLNTSDWYNDKSPTHTQLVCGSHKGKNPEHEVSPGVISSPLFFCCINIVQCCINIVHCCINIVQCCINIVCSSIVVIHRFKSTINDNFTIITPSVCFRSPVNRFMIMNIVELMSFFQVRPEDVSMLSCHLGFVSMRT